MLRTIGCATLVLSLVVLTGAGSDAAQKAQKNQMVKGTVKLVDSSKSLLVINQKVKNEAVDRELSILNTTEFVIIDKNGTKNATGKDGLALLDGRDGVVGASAAVKCDKDVNVLKVTITIKK